MFDRLSQNLARTSEGHLQDDLVALKIQGEAQEGLVAQAKPRREQKPGRRLFGLLSGGEPRFCRVATGRRGLGGSEARAGVFLDYFLVVAGFAGLDLGKALVCPGAGECT